MIKKFISVFLCIILIFSFCIFIFGAETNKSVFSVAAPEKYPKAGETFKVQVKIDNNRGFSSLQFKLAYNTNQMQFVKYTVGSALSGGLSAINGENADGIMLATVFLNGSNSNGVLAEFEFKAKANVSSYDFEFEQLDLFSINSDEMSKSVSYPANNYKDNSGTSHNTTGNTPSIQPQSSSDIPETTGKNEDKDSKQETKVDDKTAEIVFSDVKKTDWSYEYIQKAVQYKIFEGLGNGKFGPANMITRAQFVTVLYRLAGSPTISAKCPFVDINTQSSEFQDAIKWAFANGLVDGKDATHFKPTDNLQRQEAVKILFYFAGGKFEGEPSFKSTCNSKYVDMNKVASWAKDAMYWSIKNDIISGVSDTKLSPESFMTREQVAKVLVVYKESL